MLLLIHGENNFESEKELKKLISKQPYLIIHANEVNDLGELISSHQNYSLFAQKPDLLVIKDISKNKKKTIQNDFAEYLQKHYKDLNMVIYESIKLDARTKLSKTLTKIGKVSEHKLQDESRLVKWLVEVFEKEKISVDRKFVEEMINKVGIDQTLLNNEVQKLLLLLKFEKRNKILPEDIDIVSHGNREIIIWDLLDSVTAKDSKKTVKLLDELMQNNNDFPYLSTMLAKQLKILYLLKSRKVSEQDLTSELGIHPFVISKAKNQLWKFDEHRLKMLYAKLTSLDFSVKKGRMDAKLGLIMLFASA